MMPGKPLSRDPERYAALKALVEQQTPMQEIMRTLKIDHRTVHRAFPGYKVMERGEGNHIRAMNQMLQKIDKYGTVDNTNNGR